MGCLEVCWVHIWCIYMYNAVCIGVNMAMKVYKGYDMMVLVPAPEIR